MPSRIYISKRLARSLNLQSSLGASYEYYYQNNISGINCITERRTKKKILQPRFFVLNLN